MQLLNRVQSTVAQCHYYSILALHSCSFLRMQPPFSRIHQSGVATTISLYLHCDTRPHQCSDTQTKNTRWYDPLTLVSLSHDLFLSRPRALTGPSCETGMTQGAEWYWWWCAVWSFSVGEGILWVTVQLLTPYMQCALIWLSWSLEGIKNCLYMDKLWCSK